MPSDSLMIINKQDYKIFVSSYLNELEELKKESINNKDSFIYFDEIERTYNFLFLD